MVSFCQMNTLYKTINFVKNFYKNCDRKTSSRPFYISQELSTTSIGKRNFWSELLILGGDYMIPTSRDEISTRPAETDFILRLHVEIKFRSGKAGQFSTCYLIRFAFILQNWRFIDFHWFKIFLLELFSLQLCLFFFIK